MEKLLLFGSFTEEETRSLLSRSVENVPASIEKTNLQFGSLDFGSTSVPRETKSNLPRPDLSLKSENEARSAIKEEACCTGKQIKINGAEQVSRMIPNGNANTQHIGGNTVLDIKFTSETKHIDNLDRVCDAAGWSHNTHDDAESSKDVTESSSESDVWLDPPASSNVKGFPKKDASNVINGLGINVQPLLPHGLINSGNLCFLNATLQALLSCAPFIQLLQDIRTRNIPKTGFPALLAFVDFISHFDMPSSLHMKNDLSTIQTGEAFNPIMFETVLKNFTPDLPSSMSGRPRQEDAQEFLSFLMDQMHSELLRLEGIASHSNGCASSVVSSEEEDGWETVGPKNKSAVTRTQSFMPSELRDIFGGQLISVVKASGNRASATVQPFLLLHLDIFSEAVHTIEDALHLFSAPETLEGYKTSGKAAVVSASKSVKIQTPSRIMILHLMRFSYGSKGSAKLHKPVHFPLELVLGRELLASPSSEGRKYELVATITHHGRDPSKGHYTTDARHSNGSWLRYDDASVTSISTSKVLHDQAYVLFYRQV